MESHQQPPSEEEEQPWWERKPDLGASKETLVEQIEALQRVKARVPAWMWVLQGAALLYIVVNAMFMYSSIRSPAIGYVAAYMVPLSVLLLLYIYAIGELKKYVKGEK